MVIQFIKRKASRLRILRTLIVSTLGRINGNLPDIHWDAGSIIRFPSKIGFRESTLASHKHSCSSLQPASALTMAILLVTLVSQRNFAQDAEQEAGDVVNESEEIEAVINGSEEASPSQDAPKSQIQVASVLETAANGGPEREPVRIAEANGVAPDGDETPEQPASVPARNINFVRGKDKFTFYVDHNSYHLSPAAANLLEARKTSNANSKAETFQWMKALLKSELSIGIQQLWRLHIQAYTRDATFRGPYLKEVWHAEKDSFKGGWDDGDGYWINYVQHPFSGGIYAQVWCDAMPKCVHQDFGKSTKYLINGILKPLPWSALMSLNFENGPISESTLGKVALKKGVDGRYGMVDYFATPLGGITLKAATDVYHTYVRKPFDLRETRAREEFADRVRDMAAAGTLTQANLDEAAKKIPYGTRHTIALLIIRLADFNHMLSDALEFKNPARNTSVGQR
jgi:hypothetical protein